MSTSVNISSSTGFHRTGRAICVWRKHGFVSLSIPGHDPPIEITMYMDVATNPGPSSSLHQRNWQTDGTINHPPSFKIRGNSVCLNGIPNWVLKEYAEILAQPITDILNTSYKEQKLPSVWKLANITL